MNILSVYGLPGSFSTSTLHSRAFEQHSSTAGVDLQWIGPIDLQHDLEVPFAAYFPAHVSVGYQPEFPNAGRSDLPEHEHLVSARSLDLLHAGVRAVKEGRLRRVDLKDIFQDE